MSALRAHTVCLTPSSPKRPYRFYPIPLIWTTRRKSFSRTALPGTSSSTGWVGAPDGRRQGARMALVHGYLLDVRF